MVMSDGQGAEQDAKRDSSSHDTFSTEEKGQATAPTSIASQENGATTSTTAGDATPPAKGANGVVAAAALLPDPSLPAPPLHDDEEGFTADQLIQRQTELEEAARDAVPFSYTRVGCTYEKGYIRQPVYACRTCGGGGVCAGCSVGCHADHELIELFAKRNFRCDCGTLSLCRGNLLLESNLKPCTLREKTLCYAPQNDENRYSRNFEGRFCRCARGAKYDPDSEEETMLQCLVCEEWLHESCTSLRPSRQMDDIDSPNRQLCDGPLIDMAAFDLFICNECVRRPSNTVLRYYIGSKGWITCLPEEPMSSLPDIVDGIPPVKVTAQGHGWSSLWRVYGFEGGIAGDCTGTTEHGVDAQHDVPSEKAEDVSLKRKVDEVAQDVIKKGNDEGSDAAAKRQKTVNGLTVLDDFEIADEPSSKASQPARDMPATVSTGEDLAAEKEQCTFPQKPLFSNTDSVALPRLDIYLTPRFRERICRCSGCADEFKDLPFVADEEETYSPPNSDTSHVDDAGDASSDAGRSQTSSTYDLGLAALNRLPRDRMLESLEAYNSMRDALFAHLRPFAEAGRVVDADSVRDFFRQQREQRRH